MSTEGAWRCAGCTECSRCVVGYIGEEEEVAHGERQVRQPRMRHGSHQVTKLILAHKDDNAILEPSAPVVGCALVNKLYYTNVSCEWVSCLHPESLICRLHAFFHTVARFPLTIHHTSQYSEFVFKREFDAGFRESCPPSLQKRMVLVHHRLTGLGSKSTFAASSMRSKNICSKCFSEWNMIQKLSAHMKLQI